MTRNTVIFLLFFLPLQLGWAVVSNYVGSPPGALLAASVGHHDHLASVSVDPDINLEVAAKTVDFEAVDESVPTVDLECDHLFCGTIVTAWFLLEPLTITSLLPQRSSQLVCTATADPPYRPQWVALA